MFRVASSCVLMSNRNLHFEEEGKFGVVWKGEMFVEEGSIWLFFVVSKTGECSSFKSASSFLLSLLTARHDIPLPVQTIPSLQPHPSTGSVLFQEKETPVP